MQLSEDPVTVRAAVFHAPPDPGQANSLADVVEQLRRLKVWAGDPSYETIKDRVNAAWTAAGRPAGELTRKSTVAYCFRPGRRRLDTDLVLAVVQALHPDAGYVAAWRQALRVVGGEIEAVSQVRVQDGLPRDLAGFTGRVGELDRLCHAARGADAVVISAIEGMAGVGKTQLAVHAGHLLHRRRPFERVLFVNLRGFDPDPAQPPADPAAVLDGFLRLLGMPGQQIPHTLPARAAAYRDRLAGTRVLVVLDNAATSEQVRPLLPNVPGCLTLITSRRGLTDLYPATRLSVDVFTPDEADEFLTRAVPGVPVGADPHAAARIARRCGYLPLALGLIAGHIDGTPGWTLTDHADRLDERHRDRRLDTGIELALDLSYRHLPADQRRLLRLLALHPGQDFDAYAAAALTGTDPAVVQSLLSRLGSDHLLQPAGPGRYTFHDLVRAYAANRAADEEPPAERRTALTRLFDHYLAACDTAVDVLYPAEAGRRPRIPPAATRKPPLTDPDAALAWLDTERLTLIAVTVHAAGHGWPVHATRFARTLFRYLSGGHTRDALTVHGRAHDAARRSGDPIGQAHALNDLGMARQRLGEPELAAGHLRQALTLFRQAGDLGGQARTLHHLGAMEDSSGRYRAAADHCAQALALYQQVGDRIGEAHALGDLGVFHLRLGRPGPAAEYCGRALGLFRRTGSRDGEAKALITLGEVELRSGRHGPAGDRLRQALALCRQLGDRHGEAWTLDVLGTLHRFLGQHAQATGHHREALAIFTESAERGGEACALNGLGEAAHAAGRPTEALAHHTAARTIAADIDDRVEQARAHAGLGHAHRLLGRPVHARSHHRRARALYAELGLPEPEDLHDLTGASRPGDQRRQVSGSAPGGRGRRRRTPVTRSAGRRRR
ncbi:tetratricopeptide repeat protein [Jidongwangia harbinensis]|uniref:tetratricopeptide repeat protein n=1 Tax=Jidongwangia harbinensis TaxID=2878561 RepID=UPI001CD93599|nr:tetratricopeptide repeat protein [Jidongwangia harbinensis]MCA2211649.1 tetratricopeptide repeat protein [Jidongwangia harbinensis]